MAEQHGKALVPQIRFSGFTDPWEQRKLGEELGFLRNNTLSRAELSDSEGTVFDKKADVPRIANDAVANRQTCDCLQDGDVIIADTAEDSAVGKCTELCNSAGKKVFSGLHTMPLRPMRKYASGYLGHYLNSPAFHDQLLPLMQGIKVISVSRSAIEDMTMSVPSVAEQASIGAFFDRLDSLITLHQRKYDKLCVLKKSMLDKMFPKGGSLYPEIRFAGFTDPWEQRKFADFAVASGIRNRDNLPLRSYSVSNDRGFVPQDEQFENGGTMREADKSAYWIVEPGSFAYNPARINVGSIGYLAANESVIVSSLYEVFQTNGTCDDRFLWHWFKSSLFMKQIEMLQEGGVRLYFFFDKLLQSEIQMPGAEEQRRIGAFFDRLDSLITLHQRKLELLRNIKKSMLDKMFV
ncbi:restriction endonuclease subunit S [Bifidobacterium merycicum]|uniref:restriction endonuclease subunit S n=1 Tax=Bifidobacterium merycicum TaxID=78345 RepID=UPI001567E223|nr:restriction endonuclease subunit S [Bifidobacterium merycicum]